MSDSIQSISQGNYILQGTVATSAGIVGDGSTQNPLRVDETVLWSGTRTSAVTLSEPATNFDSIRIVKSIGSDTLVKTNKYYIGFCDNVSNDNTCYWCVGRFVLNGTSLTVNKSKTIGIGSWGSTGTAMTITNNWDYGTNIITEVIGINRINNA